MIPLRVMFPRRLRAAALFLTIVGLIILMSSGCTEEGPVGPAGPPGNNLMDPAIMPAVISTMPANGSTGPFDLYSPGTYSRPNFVVQFNKLINTLTPMPVSVQGFNRPQRVVLYQQYYPIRVLPRTTLNGPYDDVLAFNIDDSANYERSTYHIGSSYTITIDTSLVDINGNHLQQQYHFSFTPEPYFRATYFYPADGSVNVSRSLTIYVYFNSPVDSSIISSLHIDPPISGLWLLRTYDSLSVVFQPTMYPTYGTRYTLSVDPNAHDAEGHQVPSQASSRFRTVDLTITSTYPSDGSTLTDLSSYVVANFNGPIDTGSIRRAFSISPSVPGSLSPSTYYSYFYPDADLSPSTRYTVTFSTALMSIDSFHLAAPYSWSFTTDRFRVSNTFPSPGSIDVYRYSTMEIDFNGKIDTASGRSAFHISPSVGGTLYTFERYLLFYPSPAMDPLTKFTVTIDSTLRTRSGYTLGTPYTFSFTTGQ